MVTAQANLFETAAPRRTEPQPQTTTEEYLPVGVIVSQVMARHRNEPHCSECGCTEQNPCRLHTGEDCVLGQTANRRWLCNRPTCVKAGRR